MVLLAIVTYHSGPGHKTALYMYGTSIFAELCQQLDYKFPASNLQSLAAAQYKPPAPAWGHPTLYPRQPTHTTPSPPRTKGPPSHRAHLLFPPPHLLAHMHNILNNDCVLLLTMRQSEA